MSRLSYLPAAEGYTADGLYYISLFVTVPTPVFLGALTRTRPCLSTQGINVRSSAMEIHSCISFRDIP